MTQEQANQADALAAGIVGHGTTVASYVVASIVKKLMAAQNDNSFLVRLPGDPGENQVVVFASNAPDVSVGLLAVARSVIGECAKERVRQFIEEIG